MSATASSTASTAPASGSGQTVRLHIRRQDGPGMASYWQDFEVPFTPGMNVLSALTEIRRNPVTAGGQATTAVVWESSCLEEVCGACSMRINGVPRQGCSALVEHLPQPITIEPMSKFPVVRDLLVDRSRMFNSLRKVKAWIPIDGTYDLGPGPRQSPKDQSWMYVLSRCMTCGCCLDACPQVNDKSEFMGAAIISQVRLFNAHPTGALHKHRRIEALMGPGGIADCGNAQNCVRVCPKEIPLTQSISEMGRQTAKYAIKRFFAKPDVEM
ncbi:succinate dehydrogenase iron-sulfur subunit [bacterium]|nr:succinate dehydrogenase iron-sulfur subunit [bacterium]